MSEEDSIEIDSLNDLFIAEQILKMRNKKWKKNHFKIDVKKSN